MRSPWIMSLMVIAAVAASSVAQDVNQRTRKDGNQRTTELIPVVPPVVTPKAGNDAPGEKFTYPEKGEAKPVVLNTNQWNCGKQFTDDNGARWMLIAGAGEPTKPAKVAGWIMRSQNDRMVFVSTSTGAVYVPQSQLPPMAVLPAAQLPLGLMKRIQDAANLPKKEVK